MHDRIEAPELLAQAPVPRCDGPGPFLAALTALLLLASLLVVALASVGHPYVGFVLALVAVVGCAAPLTKLVGRELATWQLHQARAAAAALDAEPSGQSQVAGIRAGTWVCLKHDHDDLVRRAGRGAPRPLARFRFVTAVEPLETINRRIAFADGTTATWHYASRVLEHQAAAPFARAGDPPSASSTGLDCMVEQLGKQSDGATLMAMGLVDENAVHIAYAGIAWGLVETGIDIDIDRIYVHAANLQTVLLRLTPAGATWMACSPKAVRHRHEAEERKRVKNQQFHQTNYFHGPGPANVAQTTEAQYTTVNQGPSVAELITALREVLHDPRIPWRDPELAAVRPAIESAVGGTDVDDSRLRPAVRTLLEVGQQLVLGVVGNTLFEVLKRFAAAG